MSAPVSISHFACPYCGAPAGTWCYERPDRPGTYHPALAHADRRRLTIAENTRRNTHTEDTQ